MKHAWPKLQNMNIHHSTRKYYMNLAFRSMVFKLQPPDDYRKCSDCREFPCRHLQETDFWDPTFFWHIWLGPFTVIFHETSFLSCCKTWICRPGFVYGLCMIVLHHIFFLWFRNSLTFPEQWIEQGGPTAWSPSSPDLNPIDCYLGDQQRVTWISCFRRPMFMWCRFSFCRFGGPFFVHPVINIMLP
jgi:hypothetical protein